MVQVYLVEPGGRRFMGGDSSDGRVLFRPKFPRHHQLRTIHHYILPGYHDVYSDQRIYEIETMIEQFGYMAAYIGAGIVFLASTESGATFVAPLSETDLIDMSQLDFNLNSKEMIKLAEWFRNYESFAEKNNLDPHVRLLVPNSGSKLDKNTLLNTPPDNTPETVSYRQANMKRFQFNKSKLKKG